MRLGAVPAVVRKLWQSGQRARGAVEQGGKAWQWRHAVQCQSLVDVRQHSSVVPRALGGVRRLPKGQRRKELTRRRPFKTGAQRPHLHAAAAGSQHGGRCKVADHRVGLEQVVPGFPACQQTRQARRVEPARTGQCHAVVGKLGRVDHARQPHRRLSQLKAFDGDARVRSRQIAQHEHQLMAARPQHTRHRKQAVDVAEIGAQLPSQGDPAHAMPRSSLSKFLTAAAAFVSACHASC